MSLIAYGFDDKTVTLCFNGQAYADRSLVEFSITYTTDSPGRWYVYFKDNQWLNGESATIGAQDGDAFVQYEYSTAGTVYPGMRLAIDTNCGGSWTIG
ncbi:uncharacterized protein L201_000599 [Kwoniella dendrophila CBS 6074]|uniref:Uncharacterized protein n=1 Tax=Kwoniella dendrophila CBS 6074 TaxID=1295534 RepID=A0AAX4JLM4_9TREE